MNIRRTWLVIAVVVLGSVGIVGAAKLQTVDRRTHSTSPTYGQLTETTGAQPPSSAYRPPAQWRSTEIPAGVDPIIGVVPSPKYLFDQTLYVVTADRLWRSTDRGANWEQAVDWPGNTAAVTAVAAADWENNRHILLLTSADGILLEVLPDTLAWASAPMSEPIAMVLSTQTGIATLPATGGEVRQWSEGAADLVDVDASGRYVAYRQDTDINNDLVGLELHVLDLTDSGAGGNEIQVAGLLEPKSLPDFGTPNQRYLQAQRALSEGGESAVWSPNDPYLAYVSAQDSISSDLYLYDAASRSTVRLSDGPSHAYQLSWSPDGRYIFYTAASSFGTGAGYALTGIFVAAADGTGNRSLYTVPSHSSAEMLAGWVGDSTAILHSWSVACGPHELRAVDVASGSSTLITSSSLADVVVDEQRGQVLYRLDGEPAGLEVCHGEAEPGVYAWQPSAEPQRLGAPDLVPLAPHPLSPGWLVQGRSNALYRLTPTGELLLNVSLPDVAQLAVGPSAVAWSSKRVAPAYPLAGTWVAPLGGFPRRIDPEAARALWWASDEEMLYVLADDGNTLKVAESPTYEPAPWSSVPGLTGLEILGAEQAAATTPLARLNIEIDYAGQFFIDTFGYARDAANIRHYVLLAPSDLATTLSPDSVFFAMRFPENPDDEVDWAQTQRYDVEPLLHLAPNGRLSAELLPGSYAIAASIIAAPLSRSEAGVDDDVIAYAGMSGGGVGTRTWTPVTLDAGGNSTLVFGTADLQNWACPWLFVYDGQRYVRLTEVLRNIVGERQAGTEVTVLPGLPIVDGLLHLRLVEEKQERTYLDRLTLHVGGQELFPLLQPDTLATLGEVDGRMLTLEQGETVEFRYRLPAELSGQGRVDAVLSVTGYYVPLDGSYEE